MVDVQIRRLRVVDVEDFREIRLTALKKAPEMFGSTYEVEARRPLEAFADRVSNVVAFGAYVDGKIVGLSVFKQEDGPKDTHKAQITGVFVEPELRAQGVASGLLQAAIDYGRDHVEQIMLTVVEGNEAAIALYKKHGFKPYGVEPRATKIGSEYHNEVLMVLFLR
ncbi:GNAT family N-acetyltransferase [Allopusillimonas ginsengisoli]|uniref:GNAT family N-acetyltransferase n=1 Tax=Allopusillimonas ginsengisoli TaxID=453575 RepID=UPI00102084D6|nr:GNAT family N-acetyltransferase [Allopusillimonas ginsengisoli]TEA79810.1 GNAT family N-acetyltransferase [Allopusillimonas ginsengisoli]